jgi:hypothetical protein
MGKYKVRVKVEIVETDAATETDVEQHEDGSFELVMSEAQAISIDDCEESLLRANFPAIREAISKHLTEISKKKTQERGGVGAKVAESARPYRVDGEVGRFTFTTHDLTADGRPIYDSGSDLFPNRTGKQWHRTRGFKELGMVFGSTESSYRKTSNLLNRIRHQQEGGTPSRTLRENTEREGWRIQEHMKEKTATILRSHGFDENGVPEGDRDPSDSSPPETLPAEAVEKVINLCERREELNGKRIDNPVCYEDPTHTVNISMDDVVVKRQKSERSRGTETDSDVSRKYVHNTIVDIQQGQDRYILNGHGTGNVLILLMAFLLNNGLLGKRLQLFTDGQRSLHGAILRFFSWHPNMGIILDWYHLEKKCKELLSMAMKGRKVRNAFLEQLSPLLWHGMVDHAIEALRKLDPDLVKNHDVVEKLIAYLERNRDHIPCYAVRKSLGLRNSSNAGEKANDLVVSERQKHNGMSWTKQGSVALASVSTLARNKEYLQWFRHGDIRFKFAANG